MRSRVSLFALLFTLGLFVLPFAAHAQGIPFFGPIIPQEGLFARCPAGWGMLMTVINRVIALLLTLAIVFVAPLMIAWSGFLFVVNPVNASGKEQAKKILTNTIVGIVIALAGWLIVDALMAVLYKSPNGTWGTWSSLITSGGVADDCLQLIGAPIQGGHVTTPTVTAGKLLAQCSTSNTACSPAALQAAGFTATQANVMSCIAVTESSGNPSTPPYNIAHPGSNSTACGTFQIVQTTWNGAASGACSSFSNCQNAACNIQVAQRLVSTVGYTPWTCANCNSKAAICVQQYGG